jgi:hypothetical protein
LSTWIAIARAYFGVGLMLTPPADVAAVAEQTATHATPTLLPP